MKKLLFCAPMKFEQLISWTRSRQERGSSEIRWQLQENDKDKGIIIVELIKGKNQSLGLTISGGTDKSTGPIVANIRPGGLADKSDYFCIGENILEINEKDITKLKHAEIIKFVQDSGKRLRFKMAYMKTPSESCFLRTTTLIISKEDNEAKFRLRGGKSKDGLVVRPITIAELDQKGELARSGEILDGDIVLAVNDKSVGDFHITEIKSLLKQIIGEYRLKIQFEVCQPEIKESARKSIIVELSRPNENIDPGLSLDVSLEHEHHGSIIVISELKESGIASRTGALNIGDLVLAINNISMDGMSVDQARQIVNSSAKKIQLEVLCMKPKIEESRKSIESSAIIEKPLEHCSKTFKFETLPTVRHTLKQYPSRSSLTSQRRPNIQDRAGISSKTIDNAYATLRSLSYKRGTLANARQGSFDDSRSMLSTCSTLSQFNLGSMLSKTECTSVVLIAEDCDYGIEVQDGLNNSDFGCIMICAIVSGKAAERSGMLQVGDRIVSINGIRTDFMPYEEFQRMLYESVTSLRLEVEFDITDAIVPSSGTFTVKIPRSENTGIVLAATHQDDPERLHRVVDIRKGSVAYRLGILFPGDQIVHINGISTDTISLYDANEMIRKCHDVMRITVKKDEEIQGNTFAVEFDRRGKQLGITISGSEDPFGPIYITSISDDGVAGRSGAISIGDRLLAINEETLRGKPLWKAYSMLRTTCDVVKLLIKRSPSPVLSPGSKDNRSDHGSLSDIAPPAKDVQQWVLSTSNPVNGYCKKTGIMSHIREQEICQTSSQSGSTESYCELSDAADTQSSFSEVQTRPKKKVGSITRRPLLPAWQRECLKNYNGDENNRLEDFTKSDNFSRKTEAPLTKSLSYSGTVGMKSTGHGLPRSEYGRFDYNRMIKDDTAFNWKRALSSEPKEYAIYHDRRSVEPGVDSPQLDDRENDNVFTPASRHYDGGRIKGTRFSATAINEGGIKGYLGGPKSVQGSQRTFIRSTHNGSVADSDCSRSASSLALSPFQFELPSKSERYLRDFERKTEAQYNDIIEKLSRSASERVENNDENIINNSFTPVKLQKIVTPVIRQKKLSLSEDEAKNNEIHKASFVVGEDPDGNLNDDDQIPVTVHRILITREDSDEDFGFSISEKVDGSGIFVKSIQTIDSRGRRPRKLRKYDRILQVNGIKTRDLTCDQVVPLLQRAGRRLQLVVERVNKE